MKLNFGIQNHNSEFKIKIQSSESQFEFQNLHARIY